MSKLKLLNEFFTQRLTVAAVEIFGAVQEVIVEYQDEINRSKEENERLQKLLDLVFKPEIKLHRADPGQITVSVSEEVPHEQQERSPSVRQEDIEIKQIKEEQEFDNSDSTYTASYVESDSDGKNPTMSSKEDSERNNLSTTPTEQNQIDPDEEGYAVSERTSDSQLLSAVNPDLFEAQSKNVYCCLICNRSYRAKGRLTVHMRIHTETGYHCNRCPKHFKEKGKWKMHMKTHTRKRKYGCDVCEKHFKQSNHLIEHMKTHTGEKPFSCHVCEKHFTRRTTMIQHTKIHTGEKPYSCPECGRHFRKNSQLNDHIKTHTGEKPYSCPICKKHFTTNSNMMQHIRVHTGERPFQCDICGLQFTRSITRKVHIKSKHNGEHLHTCKVCDKSYINLSSLRKHVETIHTGPDPGPH